MINLEQINFFHIVYPPLTGGNHILNLLSTTFNDDENQIEKLLHLYNSKINLTPNEKVYDNNYKINSKPDLISKGFHVHYEQTNQSLNYYKNFKKSNKINLMQAHAEEYMVSLSNIQIKNNLFKNLRHTLGIVVTAPINYESRLYKRLKLFNDNNSYISKLSMDQYKLPFTVLGYELFNSSNSLLLDSDVFGESSGSEYFQDLIYKTFNIELPNQIHILHQLWVNMIDQSLLHK